MKLIPDDFVVFRRALLPFETLIEFHSKIQNDPESFRANLRELFSDPLLRQGLEISSPSFYLDCLPFLGGKSIGSDSKIASALYKFLIRSCSRATPFGVFAGYFIAELKDATAISFEKELAVNLHNELDSDVLQLLADTIVSDSSIRSKLSLQTNNSLYHVAGVVRFITTTRKEHTRFNLSQAENNAVLESVLDLCQAAALPAEIITHLRKQGISIRLARTYLQSLIDAQLLVSGIQRNVIGPDYLDYLLDHHTLKRTKYQRHLTRLGSCLPKLEHEKIRSVLQKISPSAALPSHLVHTTTRFAAKQSQLNKKVVGKLAKQLEKLLPLCRPIRNPDLDDFTSRLYQRYGQQRVPLLTALDYDYGIGYGRLNEASAHFLPLLDHLLATPESGERENDIQNKIANEIYLNKLSPPQISVELTDEMIARYGSVPVQTNGHPYTAMGKIHSQNAEHFDQQLFDFELTAFGSQPLTPLLARFCNGDDQLTQKVRRINDSYQQTQKDYLYADIAHLPSSDASNILQRPDLTEYEIPYLAAALKDPAKTIPLQDLYISSVDGKTLTLFSKKLQKVIRPVLNNAHHFASGLPVYKFLCDLSTSGILVFKWDWAHLSDADFLPRVLKGNLILSKASWKISAEIFKPYKADASGELAANWRKVQKKLGIPRFFTAGPGDQQLLIDSQSEVSLKLLQSVVRKSGHLRITELLHRPSRGLLASDHQHYVNEIIIPLKSQCAHSAQLKQRPIEKAANFAQQRSFMLTSSWLYIKIYCSPRLADQLTGFVLVNLCQKMQREDLVDKWFFVRYADPLPHLRFRFHGNKQDFWITLLKEINLLLQPKLEDGTIQNLITDSYQREIERYQPSYQMVESFFHLDSLTVASCFTGPAIDPDHRWMLALLGTDKLLCDLGLPLEDKLSLVCKLHGYMSTEFDAYQKQRPSMDFHYRKNSRAIIKMLDSGYLDKEPRASEALTERSKRLAALFESGPSEKARFQSNAADLIHMFLNRWFYASQREQEFSTYHYLKKYYTTTMKTMANIKNIPKSYKKSPIV